MKKLLILWSILFYAPAFSQGGYLGSKNGMELKVDLNPSFKRVYKVKEDYAVSSPRFFCTRLTLNYCRVITRHAEIAVGLEFFTGLADMRHYSYSPDFGIVDSFNDPLPPESNTNENFFIDYPRFYHQGLNLEYHYYRKGNLSPLGNYIGFAFKLGYCSIGNGKELTYGDIGFQIKSGAFRIKNEILYQEKATVMNTRSMITSHLNIHIGQNIPISKSLILSVQASLPLFYSATYKGKTRFNEWYSNDFYPDYYSTEIEGFAAYTAGLFYRASIDFGIKWML